ncbi:TapY2 family type IVa secretion system protein [Colwellia sp. E150_009]|jgi:hypothetical protein
MNTYLKLISFSLVSIIGIIGFATPSEANTLQDVEEPSVVIKCYTELIDGSKSINFWHTKPSHKSTIAVEIVGEKARNLQEKELPIVSVFQCVLQNEAFRDSQARNLEAKLIR